MKDYFNIEEEFHNKDRKASKKDRKFARANDRSKYKKTDRDKETLKLFKGGVRGRILKISGSEIFVEIDHQVRMCTLRGTLKQEKTDQKNLVTIGDFVIVDERGQIAHVEPRYSYLARADNLRKRKQHLIAANIDQVFITASAENPSLKPSLIDRYIIAAVKGNMDPIILVNKIDLRAPEETVIETLESVYTKMGIPFLKVSCLEKNGLNEVLTLMKGKTSVFSGQSGVGKSSLINVILGTSLRIGDIIEKIGKGAHTTTSAELVAVGEDGFCVDTPGIKSFALWDISSEDLLDYFSDLQEFASGCKYPNCTHLHEPECGVKEAVEKGLVSSIRYESYKTIRENNDEDQRNSWD